MSATVQNHMQKYFYLYSDVILRFLSDLYMDDSITGKQTEEEAFDFYLVYKIVMKEVGINLRKWLLIPNPYKKKCRIRVEIFWRICKR